MSINYYPSRSGRKEGHNVVRHVDGTYSCDCPARTECWALQKQRATDNYNDLRIKDLAEIVGPTIKAFRDNWTKPEVSLEKTKAYQKQNEEWLAGCVIQESKRLAKEARNDREQARRDAEEYRRLSQ